MKAGDGRERNQRSQNCMDCGTLVEAGDGFLYRYSGAARNLKGLKRNRYSMWTFMVRCWDCASKHDRSLSPRPERWQVVSAR